MEKVKTLNNVSLSDEEFESENAKFYKEIGNEIARLLRNICRYFGGNKK